MIASIDPHKFHLCIADTAKEVAVKCSCTGYQMLSRVFVDRDESAVLRTKLLSKEAQKCKKEELLILQTTLFKEVFPYRHK